MTNHPKAAALLALSLGLGCGAAPTPDTKGASGPVSEQQRIINSSRADLGVCFLNPPAIPDKLNGEVLTGLLVAARPLVLECLIDPKNRGPAEETSLTVKTSLASGKLTHALTGQNTTLAGEQCIRAALDRYMASVPNFDTKAAATTASAQGESQYRHVAGASPTVKLGVNEASDVAGAVRLAFGSTCACYEPWKGGEPTQLKATIKLGGKAAPAVKFDDNTAPGAQEVAACLAPKLAALPLKTTASELTVPYTFYFVSSSFDAPFNGGAPEIAFAQLDMVHGQRSGASVIAVGGRTIAAEAYDALIKQYKADPASVTLEQLQNGCNALLKADDGWLNALESLLASEQKMVELTDSQAKTNASWGEAKKLSEEDAATTTKEIEAVKKYKAIDFEACPKTR